MALLETRSALRFLNPPDARRAACVRERPECVRLEPREGVPRSDRPPVRVFLGTEPGQHRAERIFVYSIERHRDPARAYEVYLMKDLAGFDRRGWTTGFTNYRFAVPHLVGGRGRAIFNDVDEAYFGDPAELFDLDMGGYGYLATSDTETSVMLIDCERMAPIWTLESAQRQLKKDLLRRTLAIPGIRGDLPREWTARDGEFEPGYSKLQHWTTLHTQPWRPVPGRFVYERNPTGRAWFELERAADAEGYQVFRAERPSSLHLELVAGLRRAPRAAGAAAAPWHEDAGLRALVARCGAESLLRVSLGRAADEAQTPRAGPDEPAVARWDLAHSGAPPSERFDGVWCADALEFLADEDVPWVVDELFARARRFVYAAVLADAPRERLSGGGELVAPARDAAWWSERLEAAGRRHPAVYWTLEVRRGRGGREQVRVRDGGSRPDGPPAVWLLADADDEDLDQALALTEALGWPYRRVELLFTGLAGLHPRLRGATGLGLDRAASDPLVPPWPDVVIAAGPRAAPIARWVRERSRGRARLVQVGGRGGEDAGAFDAVVAPRYVRGWWHPRRIETEAPLTRLRAKRLAPSRAAAADPFEGCPHPRLALLLDGPGGRRLSARRVRRMADEAQALVERQGGSVVAVTGTRLGGKAAAALSRTLGSRRVVRNLGSQGFAALEAADAVVASGDSPRLLAQAAASGRPVYIYPAAHPVSGRPLRLRRWIERRARTRPANRRGTPRPQQGLEYLCARLLERGWIAPVRDVRELHRALYDLGVARPFGSPLELGARPALRVTREVTREVHRRLGIPSGSGGPARESG
jgi:hypothetical protein